MATISYISEKEAPAQQRSMMSASAQQSLEIINLLQKGKVARIEPEGEETPRKLRTSLAQVARRADRGAIQTWEVDGIVYAKLGGGGEVAAQANA